MKKLISFLPYTLCVAVVMLVVVSCSKDDGATGPAGPTGPTGPSGAAGGAGPAGPAGTANVIYSPWIDSTWYLLSDGSDTIITQIEAPRLDLDMLNKGEIKVYANVTPDDPTDPWVWPLPYNSADGGFIDVTYFLNTIEVTSNLNIDGILIRYVLIPGGTAARTANGKAIDWNNYAAVKAYLGLKD